MGVKGLMPFLKAKAPRAFEEKSISDYKGVIIVFDASEIIHRFCRAIRGSSCKITSADGSDTSHIYAIMQVIQTCAEHDIYPIITFDGKPPEIKYDTLAKRQKRTQIAKEELLLAKTEEDKRNAEKKAFSIKPEMIEECKRLLSFAKIPYVQSPEESDPQCAVIAKLPYVYGTAAQDNDILPFGSPVAIKDFKKSSGIQEISLDIILKELGICHSHFVDMCIVSSVDYCPAIKNAGASTAYKAIKEILREPNNYNQNECIDMPVFQYLFEHLKKPDFIKLLYPDDMISDKSIDYNNYIFKLINDERFIIMFKMIKKFNDDNIKKTNASKYCIPKTFLYDYILAKLYYTETANVENPEELNKIFIPNYKSSSDYNIDVLNKWKMPDISSIRKMLINEKNFKKDTIEKFINILIFRRNEYISNSKVFSPQVPDSGRDFKLNNSSSYPASYLSSRKRQRRQKNNMNDKYSGNLVK